MTTEPTFTPQQLANFRAEAVHMRKEEMKQEFKNVIIVLDKGFVFHGDLVVEDGWFTIFNGHNIRRYGTERGLGQLALTGPTKDTALDPVPTVRGAMTAYFYHMECADDVKFGK